MDPSVVTQIYYSTQQAEAGGLQQVWEQPVSSKLALASEHKMKTN